MFSLLKDIFDLVFPPRCRICKKPSADTICADCLASLPRISGSVCKRCGKPTLRDVGECRECAGRRLYFSLARSGGSYTGTLKTAIHELKYKNGKRLAPYLAKFISSDASDIIDAVDYIAFVPLTKLKEARRGYNQSRLIAEELCLDSGKPLFTSLVKIKEIPEQNKLGLDKRTHNVKGAFTVSSSARGKVLLIDDVYTTGSTVNECARQLKKSGASDVFVLTVARTPLVGG